ncbi:MAG: hypothetical protein ACK4ZJ_14240, partial [Allorhizobium sp.]
LALEVFDKLNAAAVPCSLLTGQEAKLVANARVTACTVEMASLGLPGSRLALFGRRLLRYAFQGEGN